MCHFFNVSFYSWCQLLNVSTGLMGYFNYFSPRSSRHYLDIRNSIFFLWPFFLRTFEQTFIACRCHLNPPKQQNAPWISRRANTLTPGRLDSGRPRSPHLPSISQSAHLQPIACTQPGFCTTYRCATLLTHVQRVRRLLACALR